VKRPPAKRVGDPLTWTSQSAGSWVEKSGGVIAILAPGQSVKAMLAEPGRVSALPSHVKCSDTAASARYLVAVPKGQRIHYYAPLVATIDNMATAGKRSAA